jgi:ABC-type phosphate transport system substrate-binding protein
MGRTVALVVLLLGVLAPGLVWAGDAPLVVIVHPERRDALTVDDLARVYLARMRFWRDGTPIVPLNLPAGTALRERFSRQVLHEDSAHLAAYWNERFFHGVFPPAVLSSTDAVKRYVASDRRAIGYIEAAQVDDTVRVVLRLD